MVLRGYSVFTEISFKSQEITTDSKALPAGHHILSIPEDNVFCVNTNNIW